MKQETGCSRARSPRPAQDSHPINESQYDKPIEEYFARVQGEWHSSHSPWGTDDIYKPWFPACRVVDFHDTPLVLLECRRCAGDRSIVTRCMSLQPSRNSQSTATTRPVSVADFFHQECDRPDLLETFMSQGKRASAREFFSQRRRFESIELGSKRPRRDQHERHPARRHLPRPQSIGLPGRLKLRLSAHIELSKT